MNSFFDGMHVKLDCNEGGVESITAGVKGEVIFMIYVFV